MFFCRYVRFRQQSFGKGVSGFLRYWLARPLPNQEREFKVRDDDISMILVCSLHPMDGSQSFGECLQASAADFNDCVQRIHTADNPTVSPSAFAQPRDEPDDFVRAFNNVFTIPLPKPRLTIRILTRSEVCVWSRRPSTSWMSWFLPCHGLVRLALPFCRRRSTRCVAVLPSGTP